MDSLSAYNFTEPKDCTLQNVIGVMENGEQVFFTFQMLGWIGLGGWILRTRNKEGENVAYSSEAPFNIPPTSVQLLKCL